MDFAENKGKLVAAGLAAVAILAVLGGSMAVLAGRSGGLGVSDRSGGSGSLVSARDVLADCDRLAAAPDDPGRTAAAVEDAAVAPVEAIESCAAAVEKHPEEARAWFQLGRVLRIAGRHDEAFFKFVEAAKANYAAALMAIGDAYLTGRGLPASEPQNLPIAIHWYEQALAAGYEPAEDALLDARKELARNTFDATLFQNGDYMKRLYEGNFSDLQFPAGFAFYMRGLARGMDDTEVIFIDPTCRPLASKIGKDILQFAPTVLMILHALQTQNPDGSWSPEGLAKSAASYAAQGYIEDMGYRDASILFNKDGRYGCESMVTEQVVGNLMLVLKT